MKQSNIAKNLVESFGYEPQLNEFTAQDAWGMTKDAATSNYAKTAAAGAVAGKAASKMLGRAIPGVGTALSWQDAYDRWQRGDRTGAVMSALAGAAYLAPGAGTAIGLGLDAANLGRDLAAPDEPETTDADTSGTAAKPATGQLAQLQQIIGAKPDDIYGPETKAKLKIWQQNNGIKADGLPGPETYTAAGLAESKGMNMKKTTVAEDIATLRDKLMCIENQVDEALPWGQAIPAAKKMASSGFGKLGQQTRKMGTAAGSADDAAVKKAQSALGPGQIQKLSNAPSVAPAVRAPVAGIEKAQSALGPDQIKKLSKSAMNNPGLTSLEKQSIRKNGIVAWIKANPKKSTAVLAAAGLGLGYGLSGSPEATGGAAVQSGGTGGRGGKRGSEELKQTQRMLNALTGANLAVDGIMGPKTQAAYDAWKSGTVKQAADIAEPLANYNTEKDAAKANAQPAADLPLGDVGAGAVTPDSLKSLKSVKSMAESIAELRDRLMTIASN